MKRRGTRTRLGAMLRFMKSPRRVLSIVLVVTTVATVWVTGAAAMPFNAGADRHHGGDEKISQRDQVAAMLATAAYQDVAVAEKAGYASSLQTLGCFQSPGRGGMGVHYINGDLMDAT